MSDLTHLAAGGTTKTKPKGYWKVITAIAGIVGALATVGAAGKASYDIPPFRVELKARPAVAGATELAIQPQALNPGFATAGTHAGPLVVRATITGVSGTLVPTDIRAVATPKDAADYLGQEGKSAIRSFVLLCAMLALAGGAAGGTAVSFGRWQRVVGGALAGLLAFAVIGLVMQQTYDAEEFVKSGRFAREGGAPVQPDEITPSGLSVVPTS
jgi:hypothetical protein